MSYHIKRVDPYWMTHPAVGAGVVAGVALCCVGILAKQTVLVIAGFAITGVSVFLATKIAVSALLGTLGFFGGLATFILFPADKVADMSFMLRVLSTLLFMLLYTVLMDAVVLAASFFYNLFGAIWGGIYLDIEQAGPEGE